MTGVVFYEGPSLIDGKPIVGIATFNSANGKTGNLVQTWILRSDVHPQEAVNSGEDGSVCGNCPLRGRLAPASEVTDKRTVVRGDTVNKGRSCYVLVYTAPSQIYVAYKQGKYPKLGKAAAPYMEGKGLRYGSYGDPVAIPIKAWNKLRKYCTGRAKPGYTHQWQDERFAPWRKRVMASTHSIAENERAHAAGWRTFRTLNDASEVAANEILCPAPARDCEHCGACNGRRGMSDRRRNIAIPSHGSNKPPLIRQVIAERSGMIPLQMA